MANQAPKNKTGLTAAAAARKNAAAAPVAPAPEPAPEPDESFDDEEAEGVQGDESTKEPEAAAPAAPEEEPEPAVRTRKDAAVETRKDQAAKRVPEVVKPTDDHVRDRKGNIRKDEDGDKMRYAAGFHKMAGFVNENGVRFPPGFKFKGGHVGSFGNVILNRCPKCGYQQSVDEAREGRCGNRRAGVERTPCGYDQVHELEKYTLNDIK